MAESKEPRGPAKKRASMGNSGTPAKRIKVEQPSISAYVPEDDTIRVDRRLSSGLYNIPTSETQLPAPIAPMAPMVPGTNERPPSQGQQDPSATLSSFRQALLGMQSAFDSPHSEDQSAYPYQELQQQQRQPFDNDYPDTDMHQQPPPAFDNFSAPFDTQPHHLQSGDQQQSLSPIALVGQSANAFAQDDMPLDPSLSAVDPSLQDMAARAMSAANASHSPAAPAPPGEPEMSLSGGVHDPVGIGQFDDAKNAAFNGVNTDSAAKEQSRSDGNVSAVDKTTSDAIHDANGVTGEEAVSKSMDA